MHHDQQIRQAAFDQLARELGCDFSGEIRIGGNYVSTVRHGDQVFVSGQVPRVGTTIAVTGRVGADTALADAQRGARICALRALAVLSQSLGGLDRVAQLLRVTVFVQSAADFTQQSEVADAASDTFQRVLGAAGAHTRTSVGVQQLPKNAAVEVDLIAAVVP